MNLSSTEGTCSTPCDELKQSNLLFGVSAVNEFQNDAILKSKLENDRSRTGSVELLPAPMVMERDERTTILYEGEIEESGAITRLAVYPGMARGDRIKLTWENTSTEIVKKYSTELKVSDPESFIDITVPKSFVCYFINNLGRFQVTYKVFPAAGGPPRPSESTIVTSVKLTGSVIPAPKAPEAKDGNLSSQHDYPDGLTILLSPYLTINCTWTSYGRDGRILYLERWNPESDEKTVVVPEVLKLIETGGEVRVSSFSDNPEEYIFDSWPLVLKVL
jgi:hypothetical protein